MTLIQYINIICNLGLSRSRIVSIAILSITATVFESLGLAMVVPIYDFISQNGDTSKLPQTTYWQLLFKFSEWCNVEVNLGYLLLFAFCAVLLRQVASYARLMLIAKIRELLMQNIRERLFTDYLSANLETQERLKSGELVNVITIELQRFNAALLGFITLINAAILISIYGIFVLWTSWQMTSVAFLGILFAIAPVRAIYRKTVSSGQSATDANSRASEFLVERLGPARLIRLSRTESIEFSKMRSFTNEQRSTMLRLERLMALGSSIIEPVSLGIAFVLIYFATMTLELQLSSLAVFLLVIMRLLPVAKDIMKGRQLMLACAASASAITVMLQKLSDSAEGLGGKEEFTGLGKGIAFRNIQFKYPGETDYALKNVSFKIASGSLSVVVGPSGAGKSTLIDLLPLLRRPNSGVIELDGQQIYEFDLNSLRRQIAFVPQQPQMYDISIAEHLRHGSSDATEIEIKNALLSAGADFVFQLPENIHSNMGQQGTSFSGGQLQRIDLARALISGASVLILDEPTSALDTPSENLLINTLVSLSENENLTIIVVTHRLRLVDVADEIIVMRDGEIDAVGSLKEVRQASPWFANAYSRRSNV